MYHNIGFNIVGKIFAELIEFFLNGGLNLITHIDVLTCYDDLHNDDLLSFSFIIAYII